MTRFHVILACFVLAFAAFPTASSAQQEPAPANKAILQFLSFPQSNEEAEPLELLTGNDLTVRLVTPSVELSPKYEVQMQSQWIIGKTGIGPDGNHDFKVLGQAPALTASRQFILLIRKGRTDAEGFNVIPIDCDPGGFSTGKLLFLNASGSEIGADVGGVKFRLEPTNYIVTEPRVIQDGRKFHADFEYLQEGSFKPFFSSTWPVVGKDARGLILLYNDSRSGSLRLHSVRQFEEAERPSEAAPAKGEQSK